MVGCYLDFPFPVVVLFALTQTTTKLPILTPNVKVEELKPVSK